MSFVKSILSLPPVLLWMVCGMSVAWSQPLPLQTPVHSPEAPPLSAARRDLFAPDNIVAWCIVPFDARKRGPEARAEMLSGLGIRRLAYDWREEHIPTFDAEVEAMKRRGIEMTAWWFPGALDATAREILAVIRRHKITPQLWVMGGGGPVKDAAEQQAQVMAQAANFRPLAQAAAEVGCKVALYNHGGWFGEPENQVAIIRQLRREGLDNVGIVYNFHHGHGHLGRFPELLKLMQPWLLAVNLNGMVPGGDAQGQKILPPGKGTAELEMMRILQQSGWTGPVGIIDHLPETDSELTLGENLTGLEWLRRELAQPGSGGPSPFAVAPAGGAFQPPRAPLRPAEHRHFQHPVNRDRIYDFYAKQAREALARKPLPEKLDPFPGLDGGKTGHWGNQNEQTWRGDGWSKMDMGSVQAGVFRGWGLTIPRAVCVQLDGPAGLSACFDPDTLTWAAAWSGGFLKIGTTRQGFLDGLQPAGERVPVPEESVAAGDFRYHGFYRQGSRVVFHYSRDGVSWLDQAWGEQGKFVRKKMRADAPEAAALTRPGAAQWPQIMETKGVRGAGGTYAVDTVALPDRTPWHSVFHIGDHDFFPDGRAALCTIEGEVWLAGGLDDSLEKVTWKRFAAGLHQPLGLKISGGQVYVMGRDQITRLQDANGDGEADRYECFSNAYQCSAAGHDFATGLQQDREGRFYLASSRQGICRVSADGLKLEVLATGFRNPDGLGLGIGGEVLAAVQEGEWTPASMLASIKPGGFYGYGGPGTGKAARELPVLYLPRGVDNSCGGQGFVEGNRWGFPAGTALHLSFGTGAAFAVIRDGRQPGQAAVVPLPGDFDSGAHRARFHPGDGQLWVTGCGGWGTYTPETGCFQRLRYTGKPLLAPVQFEARENGVILTFSAPLPADEVRDAPWLAQAWNYRYGPAYGSDEYSVRHPDQAGHDVLAVTSVHLSGDGRQVFLEIPQLLPCDSLHLYSSVPQLLSPDLFLTIHRLSPPYTDFPGYRAIAKTTPGPPADLPMEQKPHPVKWEEGMPGRAIRLQATTGLQYAQTMLEARAGERLSLTFDNPDVVPHNWVLGAPGSSQLIFDRANRMIAEPGALARHYVPDLPEVLVYTRMVEPANSTTIHFHAPDLPGDYPYLCTFPGHGMVMRGILQVK